MILLMFFCIVLICTIIAIMRSGKPFKQILNEIKFETIYNILGAKSLIEDTLLRKRNKIDLPNNSGQIALVTGGSRGIGTEIVKMLIQCDMHVIIGCRNVAAGEALEKSLRKQGIETGEIRCFQIDTGSIKSVKAFANQIKENYQEIHVLCNNAGIMFGPYVETEDGYEAQFAINYLGHFLLTHLLMPLLKAAGNDSSMKARIVNVSSVAHLAGNINFEDINFKEQYIASEAYAQSKLAQVLFTTYLQSQLKESETPVQVYAAHPGIVNTDLFNGTPLKTIFPWLPGLLFKDPIKGATPIVYACVSPKLEERGGTYISNCRISGINSLAKDVELQKKFFDFTKQLLKIQEFGKVYSSAY